MAKHPRATEPTECQACHKIIAIGQVLVKHHVSYFPEKIVNIHRSCHSRIHVGKTMYQELRPDPRQVKRWYEKRGNSYVYHTEASEWAIGWFFDTIENGWWNYERIERIKEFEVKKYWDECDRLYQLRKKLNIRQDWLASDIICI
jgi:hypothetical protein